MAKGGLGTATQLGSVPRTWMKFWFRHLRNRLKLGVGAKLLFAQFLRALASGSGSSFSLYSLSVGPQFKPSAKEKVKACPAPERFCGSQRGMVTPVMESDPLAGVLPLVTDVGPP